MGLAALATVPLVVCRFGCVRLAGAVAVLCVLGLLLVWLAVFAGLVRLARQQLVAALGAVPEVWRVAGYLPGAAWPFCGAV